MKHYNSYMDRQEISPSVHEKLLDLEAGKKSPRRMWAQLGALAACAALIVGVGVWKLNPPPATVPEQSAGQFAASYTPLPGQKDTVGPEDQPGLVPDSSTSILGDWDYPSFEVSSPMGEGQTINFFYMPAINYQEVSGSQRIMYQLINPVGSFEAALTKEDVQKIFWGPEGIPETYQTEIGRQDLPWALFWDGYTLHGSAKYDNQGGLMWLNLYGQKDGGASFQLSLCPGEIPPACCISMNGHETSEVSGVEVTAWSLPDECGSQFITQSNIGVRFENRITRYVWDTRSDEEIRQENTWFNTLFVRQALTGGLYLDHLITNENIPAWREEEFSTLAQARQEAEFAPYLPTSEPEGYSSYTGNKEFYGHLSYQEGTQNTLFVRWSRGYDDVRVDIYRDGTRSYDLADPDNPASYDVRLYEIPWCDSVPEEYQETVNRPAFKAEDMSLAIVEARGREKDTGSTRFNFEVLHSDGTLVYYSCDGLTARQVWAMVEETLD